MASVSSVMTVNIGARARRRRIGFIEDNTLDASGSSGMLRNATGDQQNRPIHAMIRSKEGLCGAFYY
jgi:hypothetical protein